MKTFFNYSLLFGLFLFLYNIQIFAQLKPTKDSQIQLNESLDIPETKHACGLQHAIDDAILEDPDFVEKQQKALQKMIKNLKKAKANNTDLLKNSELLTIPVVFHVIYGCELAEENISDNRLLNALQQLNDDFQGNSALADNYYTSLNGGMNIEFVLAEKDPLGSPTTGIVRTQSPLTYKGIGQEEELRELIMWPRDKYLNVYVLHSVNPIGSSGVAWYPSQSDGNNYLRDGVSIAYWAVDPDPNGNRRNYQSILAHEVGHWLGLRHIWGNSNGVGLSGNCSDDDFSFLEDDPDFNNFNDTPNTIGSFTMNQDVCQTSYSCGNRDMVENLMNYTGCQNMFTVGQCNYMQEVLMLNVAERNELHSSTNLAQTLYSNATTPRLVFQNTIVKENNSNDGSINYELDIELVNANFINPSTTLSSGDYTVDWANGFDASNLTVDVITQSTTTAKLIVSGSTTDHYEDVEFSITFDNDYAPFNKYISVVNRSKTLQIDFIQTEGITYRNVAPNIVWGPEDVNYKAFFPIEGRCLSIFFDKNSNEYKLVTICGGIEIRTTNGKVTTFTNPSFYISPNGTYSEEKTLEGLILNVNNIALGAEFYVAFRTSGCADRNYGWIRMEKILTGDCEQIIIHDMAYNSDFNQGLYVNTFDKPTLTFESNIIQETLPESETYSSITATIKGSFNGYFVNNLDINDFEISPVSSYFPDANEFNKSNVTVTKVNSKTVIITANVPEDLTKDFEFMIRFNNSAFVGFDSDDLAYAQNDLIYVDILDPLTLYPEDANNIMLNDIGQLQELPMRLNKTQVNIGFIQLTDGYEVYNPLTYNNYDIEIACKNPSSDSRQIQLFEHMETIDDYNSVFKSLHLGIIGDSSNDIGDNTYITLQDANSFIDKETFILCRLKRSCGVNLYFWVHLDFETGGMNVINYAISAIPNTSLFAGEYPPCEAYATNNNIFLYIEDITIGNFQNTTDYGGGYVDYSNLIADLNIGTSYPIELIQANPPNYSVQDEVNWYVLIDWNNDNHFEASENIAYYENSSVLNESLFIPTDAPLGLHKMRIILSLHSLYELCGDFQYGEVEDYTINIIDPNYVNPCPSNGLNTSFTYIDEVTIGDMNNITGNENIGYVDYSSIVANLNIGFNPLELVQGNPSSTTYDLEWYLFIDWNSDDVFDISESVGFYQNSQSVNGTLEIPSDVPLGLYRMRIIQSLHDISDFCGDFQYGQVEDYTVNISEDFCLEDVNYYYTDDIPANTHSSNYIKMKGSEITSGENVIFKAGDYIEILPSENNDYVTLIGYGSEFEASIEDCSTSAKTEEKATDDALSLFDKESTGLKVYPNPFSDVFIIEYNIGQETPVSIEIYSMTGRLEQVVMEDAWHYMGNYSVDLDGSHLSKGIYIVNIRSSEKQFTQKLVKL